MRTPHTSTYQGKMVGIKLRDGRVVKGKFYDRRHDRVMLGLSKQDRVEILIKDIGSFMIIKGN